MGSELLDLPRQFISQSSTKSMSLKGIEVSLFRFVKCVLFPPGKICLR